MTNPVAHCPFCLEEFDLLCDTKIQSFGNMDMVIIECPRHGDIIVMTEDIYSKSSGGDMLADCPKCNEHVLLRNMTNLRGCG